MFGFSFKTVFLRRPRWPQIYHPLASVCAVLGIQARATTFGLCIFSPSVLHKLQAHVSSYLLEVSSWIDQVCRFIIELNTVVLTSYLILFYVPSTIIFLQILQAQERTLSNAFSRPIQALCFSHSSPSPA